MSILRFTTIAVIFSSQALLLRFSLAWAAENRAPGDKYTLVWADEFDQAGPPHAGNWGFEHGFVRNQELQWYQEQNAFCEDGQLVIEARRERIKNPRYISESRDWRRTREYANITSACVLTRGKHEWKYGKFVMRAKLDTRPGLWPAFWTLGTRRGWPGCGEIDVMEYYDGKILANVAWLGAGGRPAWDTTHSTLNRWKASWVREFHIWQLLWEPERIQISLDGEVLNETSLSGTINHDGKETNPFHEPHYLLLNLAVGGTQGGEPTESSLPARYEIDYVRVYQKLQGESEPAGHE